MGGVDSMGGVVGGAGARRSLRGTELEIDRRWSAVLTDIAHSGGKNALVRAPAIPSLYRFSKSYDAAHGELVDLAPIGGVSLDEAARATFVNRRDLEERPKWPGSHD
jgi:hypothetical protein